jgi:hypothetical protein
MAAHAFWVIVDGTTPTAFRAKERETLVPTLVQLQRTQPAVVLRWFDRGQLWDSPIAARQALLARRRMKSDRQPGWRPGGSHADPRERYKLTRDQKRARFKKRHGGGEARRREVAEAGSESQKGGKPGSRETWKPESRSFSKGGWKKSNSRRPRQQGRPFRAGARRRPGPGGPKRDR